MIPDYEPYITGDTLSTPIPLARYLPPIPQQITSRWLYSKFGANPLLKSSNWILDPFGTSPLLPVEVARSGYRVLVAVNNPIMHFLIELFANPPPIDDFHAALAEIADTYKGYERLEPHILSLYKSMCNQCGEKIIAESFIWERNSTKEHAQPIAKIYHCQNCKQSGEFPVDEQDIALANQFSASPIDRTRAVERVAPMDDPIRENVEEVISLYTARSLYSIITFINKRDGLKLSPQKLTCLNAILLNAFDTINSLWAYPISRSRPKQIFLPQNFREYNFWFALEQSLHLWTDITSDSVGEKVEITEWPKIPQSSSGVCIYKGRVKDLMDEVKNLKLEAIVTVFPRPNQAFWSLSAIWSGWLWGNEAVKPIKTVLKRKRYDWGWQTLALTSTLYHVAPKLSPSTQFLGLIGEVEPGFITSTLSAADLAGFELISVALRSEGGHAQLNWRIPDISSIQSMQLSQEDITKHFQHKIQNSIQNLLLQMGEPTDYLHVHTLSLASLVSQTEIPENHNKQSYLRYLSSIINDKTEIPSRINSFVESSLTYRFGFIRLGGSDKSIEVGQWWLRDKNLQHEKFPESLSDKVEKYIVNSLVQNKLITLSDIDRQICQNFRGFLTPSPEFIQVCVESYALQTVPATNTWSLRTEDEPDTRKKEIIQMHKLLNQVAHNLGFNVEGNNPIIWKKENGKVIFAWYIIASAIFSNIILNNDYPPQKSCILLPGGRANLVAYKLNHDFRMHQAIENGWRFIKFRQIRAIAENPILYPEFFENQLSYDSITYNAPQMRLF